ncbi:hypothetical protein PLESTB_000391800 [Pleodorina starrii]|uniref:Uncharacterized protein n=1 Tax=Pleodorina starrii TaxID=330485 RepID=A0A9W6BE71_9CHLO|nr:hypothetical protein PLESTB_000391800 [Pleodorina starrii]GLC73217.1 hypothetical protein PLESTF_001348100 [Pleodorina starrii]
MDEDNGLEGVPSHPDEESARERLGTILSSLAAHEALASLSSPGKPQDPAPRVVARVSSQKKGDSEAGGSASRQQQSAEDRAAMVVAKERGKGLFNAQQYGEAANAYTEALRYAHDADDVATLLSNRSAAYASLSRMYRSRPARTSEYSALFDLDPTSLALMALKDAERAATVRPDWAKAHSRKGTALFLLERYLEAREAYLEGLALDPTSAALQEGMREVQALLVGDRGATPPPDAAAGGAGAAAGGGAAGAAAKRQRSLSAAAAAAAASSAVGRTDMDDWDCSLCARLLFEPVTTPCGHTFCRECFARAIDHRPRCPYCRTVLHVSRDSLPVTITLANIISKTFPEEYADRRREAAEAAGGGGEADGGDGGKADGTAAAAAAAGGGAGGGAAAAAAAAPAAAASAGPSPPSSAPPAALLTLPLFVMSLVMPGEGMSLNIFEPRYRLMVRRVMEGGRRLGLAQARRDAREIEDVAVEAEIIECQPQPDGRYYLELVGRRRVRIRSHSELDGYRVARCEVMQDTEPRAGSPEAESLPELVSQVDQQVDRLLAFLRAHSGPQYGRQGLRIRAALDSLGERPPPEQAERFSMWAATAAGLVVPDLDKAALLRGTDTAARLRRVQQQLGGQMAAVAAMGGGAGAGGPGGCGVM